MMQIETHQSSSHIVSGVKEDVALVRNTKPKEAFLPKISNHRAPSPDAVSYRAPGSPSAKYRQISASTGTSSNAVSSFLGQLERIRSILKDREAECSLLKQEIAMLKQVRWLDCDY